MASDLLKTGDDFHGTISATRFASLTWRMEWLEGCTNYAGLYPQERRKSVTRQGCRVPSATGMSSSKRHRDVPSGGPPPLGALFAAFLRIQTSIDTAETSD
jgi:hypothetical protein